METQVSIQKELLQFEYQPNIVVNLELNQDSSQVIFNVVNLGKYPVHINRVDYSVKSIGAMGSITSVILAPSQKGNLTSCALSNNPSRFVAGDETSKELELRVMFLYGSTGHDAYRYLYKVTINDIGDAQLNAYLSIELIDKQKLIHILSDREYSLIERE